MTAAKRQHSGPARNYREILAQFGAEHNTNREAVRYLEGLGFRTGQARSAVYQYRKEKGLVRPRPNPKQASS